ncbi:putative F-box protein At4g17565 [Setaria italica]|uniref:F-box domain-containing protein n=2 Tax=Setaria italica TaxID=4555 RepID=K3XSD8_SETIT|nr:putative F-box protein At4g17565 [Setaria italica]
MAAPESDGIRPWADLPVEMVDAIVQQLDLFSTTRLASVCTSWSTAVATNAALPFGTPCLLMTGEEEDDNGARGDDHEDWSYQLMNLTTERGDSFPALIRDVQEQWWVGGKDDWLAVVDRYGGARLLNPYTGRQIDLPRTPAAVGPGVTNTGLGFDRIVVCATPSDDEGYLVIGMVNDYLLAIARGRDDGWTELRNPDGHPAGGYKDAVVHKGKVFAVDKSGSIYAWDLQGGACPEPEKLEPPHIDRGEFEHEGWKLAESADRRRLLLVWTYGKMVNCRRFKVYGCFDYLEFVAEGARLCERDVDAAAGLSDGDAGWSPVSSLGDHSLFLGANYPFFARVGNQGTSDSDSVWGMVRPNCICFAKGHLFQSQDVDVEVFDLDAEEYQYNPYKLILSNSRHYSSYQEPIWFRPTLKNYDLE